MELGGYFGLVRRWWLVLLAAVALASLGGYIVASRLPAVYEAEVRVLVGPLNTDLDTQRAAGQLTNTYAQLVTSRRVTGAVIDRVGADMTPGELEDAITAVPNDLTRLVVIRVQDGDANQAAALANALADELATLAAESDRPEGQTQVIDPAIVPETPAGPQVLLIVMLAAFAGLLAAIALVVVIESARGTTAVPADERGLRQRTGRAQRGAIARGAPPMSEH